MNPAAPVGRNRPSLLARVLRTEQVTPHLRRIVFSGEDLAGFIDRPSTDRYVKLTFAPKNAPYAAPYDVEAIRAAYPSEVWPVTRTYTVRAWNAATLELTVDFVIHGTDGVAGPWAAAATAGDALYLSGPGGAYAPRDDADWHLFVGDDSALPAIAVALESLPAGSKAVAVLLVPEPADRQTLHAVCDLDVTWLYHTDSPDISAVVQQMEFPAGTVHAFVHGDAGFVRELRRFLRVDKAVPRDFLSVSGYWKRGLAEDGWRENKREWAQPVDTAEAEIEAALT